MERDRVNRTPVSPVAFENSAFAGVDVIDAEGEGSCQVRSPYEVSPEKMEWPDAEKTLDSSSKCVYEQQLTGSKLFQTDFPQEGLPSKYIGITSHIEAEHEVFPHKRKRSVSPDSSVDYTSIFPSVKLAEEEKTSQYQLLESSTMKDARYTENELLIHGTDEVNSKEILGHVDSFQDSYPQELCAEGFEMVSKDLYWESNRPESPFEIITKEEIEDIQYLMMKKHTSQNLQKIYSNVAKQDEIQSSMEPLTQSKEVCDNSLESTVRRKEIKESTVQNKQDKIILDKSRESVTTFSDENLFKPKEDATETKNKPKVDDTVEGKQLYDSLEGLPSFLYDVEIREGSSFLTESGTVVLHEKTEPYGTSEKRLGWDYHSTFQNNQIFLAEPKKSVVNTKEIDFGQDDKARDDLPQGARESLPRISASSRTISLEFEQDSDDSVNLSDTPAVSGSEDVLTVLETYINAPTSQTSFPRNVRDFSLDTSRSSMYPTLVEYKEEEEESLQDEPMEVESDKGVDEADDLSEVDTTTRYHYRMQFDRDFFYEFETEPDFRPLYTHQEEDEDAYEDTFQYRSEKPLSPIMASDEEKLSTPDYESVEAKKFFSRSDERDDESLSSLQEFERLEAEIIRGRKSSQSSLDSLNNKQQHSKSGENDDVSMNSLTEFELLERECAETERIEAMAKEERARLSEIEEGHESQISEGSQDTLSDGRADGKDSSGSEDFEERLHKADRITTQVQANVEQFHIVQSGSEFPQEGSGLGITDDLINSVPSVEQNLSHEVVTTNARIGHVETAFYSHSGEISSDFSDDGDLQESVSVTLGSMERVPNLNENYPSHKEPKPVSTHFFREVRKPDVDYALEATDQTLSQTSEPNLCTDNIREKHSSLQEAKIKELIEYIGQTESKKLNLKVIAEEDQEWVENNIKDVSPSQNDTSSSGKDSHGIDKRGEWFPSSCESVDPSSSAGTLATYQFDTDSVMSSSLNSMHTSGEESTMISSTDTLGFDYQMSSPFGETHPGTVPVITEQPELDQEGNICISSRDNILFEENIPSKAPRDKQHFITEKTRSSNVDHLPCGVGVIKSDFVEGLESLDENDRKILIERVKQNIVLNQRHSISTESQEALEEFFRKQLEGAKENLERTFDEKSNIVVDRSSKQPSKVEDHLEQFNDCGELHPHDRGKKMLDEDGNIIWTTSKVVIPPQVKMVTLSKFNKEKRFLQHPQMLTTKDFGISDKDTSYSHYSPTPTQSSEMSYTSETLGSCMDVIDADQCLLPQAASGMQTGSS